MKSISKTDFVSYLETHKNSGYQVKSVMSGCYVNPETLETKIGNAVIKLSSEQVFGLASSYVYTNTFQSNVTDKARDSFVEHLQAGNCGPVPAGESGSKTPVKKIPESISDLSIDQIQSIVGADKTYKVNLPISEVLRLGLYDVFTKTEQKDIDSYIESEKENQKVYTLISELFGNYDYRVLTIEDSGWRVKVQAPMEKAGILTGKIHASKSEGWTFEGKPDFVDSGRTDGNGTPIYVFAAILHRDLSKRPADDATGGESDAPTDSDAA